MPPKPSIPNWRLIPGWQSDWCFNASLTFENVWPTPKIRWGHSLSIELAVCVLLLAIAHRMAGTLARKCCPVLWVVLVAGHYLDETAPGLYGREFNLYWDSQHLGNVTGMLASAAPLWLIALAAMSLIAALVLMFLIARLALRWLASAMAVQTGRRVLGTQRRRSS